VAAGSIASEGGIMLRAEHDAQLLPITPVHVAAVT